MVRMLNQLAKGCCGLVFGWLQAGGEASGPGVFLSGAEPGTLDPAIITGQPDGRSGEFAFRGADDL